MKSNDQLLLEQSYELIQARQFLMSEGYTKEEVDTLVVEGKVWDAVKSAGKKVGKYVAPIAAAASMMGGAAYGDDAGAGIRAATKDLHDNAPKLVQDVINKSNAEFNVKQQTDDQLISSTTQKAFGDTLSKDGMQALKTVISRIDFRDPNKSNKIVQVIQGTAKKLNGNGQDKYDVYSAASEILFKLK